MRKKNPKPEGGSMGNAGQEDTQDKRTCAPPCRMGYFSELSVRPCAVAHCSCEWQSQMVYNQDQLLTYYYQSSLENLYFILDKMK